MASWEAGQADIDRLIAGKDLEMVTGAEANGDPLLEKAHRTVATAAEISADDPYSSYVLAYDAARVACTALLAQQGLRPTTRGGHYAVEQAVRSQFGHASGPSEPFAAAATNWSTRTSPTTMPPQNEAAEAVQTAQRLIAAADQILPRLSLFGK
jgi:hypothetical protein